MLAFALTKADFKVVEAVDAKAAKHEIANQVPDLIILDWMLPGQSGIEFAAHLKKSKQTKNIRLILLTARAEEENKIKGLDIGADDYITKPFSPRELIARINAILRRGIILTPDGILESDPLILNTETHTLMIHKDQISLSAIEYKLLYFFMSHPDRIYSREQLLQQVWGGQSDIHDRTVDVQIKRLRERLAPYGCDTRIKTLRGSGYQFIGSKR